MKITADGEKLLVGDSDGNLKLISLSYGEVIKIFGRVHDFEITGITIKGEENFFTSSTFGDLKQWNYRDNTLITDSGKLTNSRIYSLCL